MARIEMASAGGGGGSSAITGSGAADQVAVFTGAQAIGGSAALTFDGTTLSYLLDLKGNAAATATGAIVIRNSVKDGSLGVSGGDAITDGGNIIFYGTTHATKNSDIELRGSTTVRLLWDQSAVNWTMTSNELFLTHPTGSAEFGLIRGGTTGTLAIYGSNAGGAGRLTLYANSHATKAQYTELHNGATMSLQIDGATRFSVGSQGTNVSRRFEIGGSPLLTGTTQYKMYSTHTFANTATAFAIGHFSEVGTAASAWTCTLMANVYAKEPVVGAGSTITTYVGFLLGQGIVATNYAYLADNGSFSGTYFFHQGSTVPSSFNGYLELRQAANPASATDLVRIGANDASAGNRTLSIGAEAAVVTETVVSDRTWPVLINGTVYKICLKV